MEIAGRFDIEKARQDCKSFLTEYLISDNPPKEIVFYGCNEEVRMAYKIAMENLLVERDRQDISVDISDGADWNTVGRDWSKFSIDLDAFVGK